LAVKVGQARLPCRPTCLTQPASLVSLPTLFVQATSALVLIKWNFSN
jgi:hypothetical protein